ncbi:respiratory nitrate reductase subunit gamma [Mycobacterium leprae]|uniref:respiratory nitrate reductase subunit gamma n=1 Tax=Mycobacterium leprae TaxID=1769 RepID=UPI0034D36B7F
MHDCRQTGSIWLRSLDPCGDLMSQAPWYVNNTHTCYFAPRFVACTRLVYTFSEPLGYLFRPCSYLVYRSRELVQKHE